MEKLRIGLIGGNAEQSWAKYSHVPALQALSDFELRAVATRHEDSANRAAAAFGAKFAFSDYRELVKSHEVDIVTISVKVPEHREVVLAALEAGKHVYCEWPLARDLSEARELAAAAAKHSKSHVVVGLQGRVNPAVLTAIKILKDGAIGKPLNSRIVSASSGFGAVSASGYKYFDDPKSGANAGTIMGGHALDLSLAVLGKISEVQALSHIQFPSISLADTGEKFERIVPDHYLIMLRNLNDSVASIELVGGQPGDSPFLFQINGTEGYMTLTGGSLFGFQGGDLKLSVNGENVKAPELKHKAEGAALNIAELYSLFGSDIRSNQRTVPNFEHAVSLTKLVDSLMKAADDGCRYDISNF